LVAWPRVVVVMSERRKGAEGRVKREESVLRKGARLVERGDVGGIVG